MNQGEEALVVLIDLLNERELDYMIVGSFSSNRYGVGRATQDADLVLRLETSEREQLLDALPEGFEIDPQSGFEMVTATWRRIVEVPSIPFTLELFELSDDAHDQCRFERRKNVTLLGRKAWLPTPEDVIVQKLRWHRTAKRGKDFDDVVAVMGVQGEAALDWEYIRGWCTRHHTLGLLEEARSRAAEVWEPGE